MFTNEVWNHRKFINFWTHPMKTNSLMWRLFMSSSMKADMTVKTITSTNPSWTRSPLSHDEVIKWTKAKVFVYSDSVLCFGKMLIPSEANERWTGQVVDFQLSDSYAELLRNDGEPNEFEWNILPGLTSLQILQKIQDDLQGRLIEPEEFGDRIIFMSVFNDIDRTLKGNEGNCISNSDKVKTYAQRFSQGHWTFFGLGDEKKWYGNRKNKPEGKWDSVDSKMVQRFRETGHHVFAGASALSRWILQRF